MERFDPRQCLELIQRHRVTQAQFVPTMFVRMLRLPTEERERYDLSSLQRVVHAAAPCPVEVKRQMLDSHVFGKSQAGMDPVIPG
jgi:acyl-CoA synthetase (AMP-forming)/AMP-acid ligase II